MRCRLRFVLSGFYDNRSKYMPFHLKITIEKCDVPFMQYDIAKIKYEPLRPRKDEGA